jgi:hypothetical protein
MLPVGINGYGVREGAYVVFMVGGLLWFTVGERGI